MTMAMPRKTSLQKRIPAILNYFSAVPICLDCLKAEFVGSAFKFKYIEIGKLTMIVCLRSP